MPKEFVLPNSSEDLHSHYRILPSIKPYNYYFEQDYYRVTTMAAKINILGNHPFCVRRARDVEFDAPASLLRNEERRSVRLGYLYRCIALVCISKHTLL